MSITKLRIFETFAGIGSQLQALNNLQEKLNIKIESIGAVEWYLDAIISYQIIHYGIKKPETKLTKSQMINLLKNHTISSDSKQPAQKNYFKRKSEAWLRKAFPYLNDFLNNNCRNNFSDITKLKSLPKKIDIFTYSFPCQDLSQQGNQKGLGIGTRSGLLYEVKRLLKLNLKNLPKVLLMENVKALTQKKFQVEFNNWIRDLKNLGYNSTFKVLNSADFGSPQNRERIFMVSVLGDNEFQWPKPIKHKNDLTIILKNKFNTQEYFEKFNFILNFKRTNFITTKKNITKSMLINYTNFNSENYLYAPKGLGPTLTASGANSRLKFYFEKENKVRVMNAFEAYEYMGFTSNESKKIKSTNLITENKMIFTCGNSISIEVLEAIFEEIIKCLK